MLDILPNEAVLNSRKAVLHISEVLQQQTHIKFLVYIIQYDDGSFCDVISSQEWTNHFYNNYLKHSETINSRLRTGVHYWRNIKDHKIQAIAEDARVNFDIDERIEFVYRDEANNCYHLYSFCSSKKYADSAYAFYHSHRTKLLKFISYFNREASAVIADCNKPENRIIIPNYKNIFTELSTSKRDRIAELRKKNAISEISDKEFEVMLLFAHGYTATQIARVMHKSLSTVHTHIEHIKSKLCYSDRASMHAYLRDNNLDWLIKFSIPPQMEETRYVSS